MLSYRGEFKALRGFDKGKVFKEYGACAEVVG